MENNLIEIELKGEQVTLFSEKAMYWNSRNTLFIADLHLGKASHFRNQGIPVPVEVGNTNIEVLDKIVRQSGCTHLVFLGDLFHSIYNKECEDFLVWRGNHMKVHMSLILGNHDVLDRAYYEAASISTLNCMSAGPFVFTHAPLKRTLEVGYNVAGHLHPGIRLTGRGKQSLTLPCFYFGADQALMPSFGEFTGKMIIKPGIEDQVYAIAKNSVRKVV